MAEINNLQAVVGISGTKAAVEALSATLTEIKFAYATDTEEIGLYVNGAWVWGAGGGTGVAAVMDNSGNFLYDNSGKPLHEG